MGTGIGNPLAITAGADGALWFTNSNSSGSIGRITTTGTLTSYNLARNTFPLEIAAGPDTAMWFTNQNITIGRITTS